MARSYICVHFDFLETYAKCSDEEFGRLIRAALRYGRDGEEPSFPEGSKEDLLWLTMEGQVRRDINSYQKKVKAGTSKRVTNSVTEKTAFDGRKEVVEMQKFLASMENTSTS